MPGPPPSPWQTNRVGVLVLCGSLSAIAGSSRLSAVAHERAEEVRVLALELADLEPVAELRRHVDVAGADAVGDQHGVVEAQAGVRQQRPRALPFSLAVL